MGVEHKESLQECQTSPEGIPLSWAREHGIDSFNPGSLNADAVFRHPPSLPRSDDDPLRSTSSEINVECRIVSEA